MDPDPAVSHLSPDQLEELEAELRRQLDRLRRSMELTDQALQTVELDQTAVGRLSRMDSLQNQSLTQNLRERESGKLGQLTEAMARLEAGSYGLCVLCGGAIPFERLFVFPETPSCAACAEGA